MQDILDDKQEYRWLIGDYDPPQGNKLFISELAKFLQEQFGLPVSEKNIVNNYI